MYRCQQAITWLIPISTETLAVPFITRMYQTGVNASIKQQVNSINPYPLRYQGTPKWNHYRKIVMDVDIKKREWEKYWWIMRENWKHDLSGGANCKSRRRHKQNRSFRTIISMGQDQNNSTIILIPQFQPLPNLKLFVINLKWTQSNLKTHYNDIKHM